ncbi:hypothetical protein M3P21_21440, partial [Ruegeria sp. 2012CJ41-6]
SCAFHFDIRSLIEQQLSVSLVSTHWRKPSDFQSELLQREESSYCLTLWKMSRSRVEGSFSRG